MPEFPVSATVSLYKQLMTSAKRYPTLEVFVVRAESSKRASEVGQSNRFAHAHILPSFYPFQFPFFPKMYLDEGCLVVVVARPAGQ